MASKGGPWVRPFQGNLPSWIDEQKSLIKSLCIATIIPIFFGASYIHLAPEECRRRVLLQTTNFAACSLVLRSIPMHSGLQIAAFGISVRTLEFHPMTAMKRFLLPVLPLGLAVMAVRAAPDVPRLGLRYTAYSAAAALGIDAMAAFANAVPVWYLKYSLVHCLSLWVALASLAVNEEVGVETGRVRSLAV